MTKETAEIIALISMISSIVPLLVGGVLIKRLSRFYKTIWVSIVISLLFDTLSFLCFSYPKKFSLCGATDYYPLFSILVWGIAFRYIIRRNSYKTLWFDVFLVTALLGAFYLGITNNGAISTNYPGFTIQHLYIIGGSTLLVMYYLIIKKEIANLDLPIITVLSTNIIHYSTVIAIFIFFKGLAPEDLMNLYLVKWLLFIIANLIFAYVFYHVGRGKWKSA